MALTGGDFPLLSLGRMPVTLSPGVFAMPAFRGDGPMKPVAAVAIAASAIALAAVPAVAKQDPTRLGCTQVQNGKCSAWAELTPQQAKRVRMNDVFGPDYPYYQKQTDLPADTVREYGLDLRSRYITTSDGYIFVIDPEGFEVTRVIAPESATYR